MLSLSHTSTIVGDSKQYKSPPDPQQSHKATTWTPDNTSGMPPNCKLTVGTIVNYTSPTPSTYTYTAVMSCHDMWLSTCYRYRWSWTSIISRPWLLVIVAQCTVAHALKSPVSIIGHSSPQEDQTNVVAVENKHIQRSIKLCTCQSNPPLSPSWADKGIWQGN